MAGKERVVAYPTDRVILHDRAGNLLPELSPEQVYSRLRTEEINGEHELVIVTTRRMQEGWRALTVDGSGRWREWVLTEPDEAHEAGETALGTYRFVWSLQYDLTWSYAHTEAEAGMASACSSHDALQMALEGVNGWEAGPCDAPQIEAGKGCVMIYESAWSRLSKVVEATGGEVDAEITVSNLYGVTSRKAKLNAHVGSTEATRRFDWGHDVSSIRRIPDPGPYYCRVVPLGNGEQEYAEDDETTFEWPLDITEETGDPDLYYIQDNEAAEAFKVPDGNGGWLYPTKAVSYSEDDPELLLNAAMADLHNHTRPGVTYEADVVQFAKAGMDAKGVSLGDDVQIVDRGFNPDAPLRLQGRVTRIEVDELSPETTTMLTIGSVRNGIASTIANSLAELSSKTTQISDTVAHLNTESYLRSLLDRINAEIAATGGYAYLVPGQGIITYDTAVSDPLVGSEASQVVQMKGGSIRIANSRNDPFTGIEDWDWKTVFTSGSIASEVITAIEVISGFIGSPTSGAYWDIDNGVLQVRKSDGTLVASFSADGVSIIASVLMRMYYNVQTGAAVTTGTSVVATNSYIYTADSGAYWDLSGNTMGDSARYLAGFKSARHDASGNEAGYIMLIPFGGMSVNAGHYNWSSIASSHGLALKACMEDVGDNGPVLLMMDDGIRMMPNGNALYSTPVVGPYLSVGTAGIRAYMAASSNSNNGFAITATSSSFTGTTTLGGSTTATGSFATSSWTYLGPDNNSGSYVIMRSYVRCDGSVNVAGSFTVTGSKSRAVPTEDGGTRLLSAYETPAPYFGDIGSGLIGEDGTCIVSIDPVFAETARTDMAYQVFLQKCGEGDLWVSEKRADYFVVKGTASLPFDWEVKAHQRDFESTRLEEGTIQREAESMGLADLSVLDEYGEEEGTDYDAVYFDELHYIQEIEATLKEEAA